MGQSDIVTKFRPDPPIVLNAEYDRGDPDRRYIDDQILGTQQMLADGLLNGVVCSWFRLSPTSAPLAPGMVFCVNPGDGLMTKITPTTVLAAGTWLGLAFTSVSPGSTFRGAIHGLIPATTTGLGPGVASVVRVNLTTAFVERAIPQVGTDVLMGICDENGGLLLRATGPAGPTGATGAQGIQGVPGVIAPIGVLTVTGTTTISATWLDVFVLLSSPSVMNVTVPTDATFNAALGKVFRFMWHGAGQPIFLAAGGVTLRTPETLKLRKQYSLGVLTKIAANDWSFTGDLELA